MEFVDPISFSTIIFLHLKCLVIREMSNAAYLSLVENNPFPKKRYKLYKPL